MSNRALGWIAAIFGVVLLSSVFLLLDRKGYLSDWKPQPLVFENHALLAERGDRVMLRPIVKIGPSRRYWVAGAVTEPESDDPVYTYPHVRAGVEERQIGSERWEFVMPVRYVALARCGALRDSEFLDDIRHVTEKAADGGERTLVCATYGDMEGGRVVYYYDPERPTPLFGWIRRERFMQDQPDEIFFASAAGKKLVGSKPDGAKDGPGRAD